jgi:hypothetical protein
LVWEIVSGTCDIQTGEDDLTQFVEDVDIDTGYVLAFHNGNTHECSNIRHDIQREY